VALCALPPATPARQAVIFKNPASMRPVRTIEVVVDLSLYIEYLIACEKE
jgi:hypothetical protein